MAPLEPTRCGRHISETNPLYSARQRLDQPLHPEPGLLRLPVLPRRRPALHAALCLQGMAAREGSKDGPD